MTEAKQLTVFYNGSCPFCAREITFYRRRRGAGRVSWIDISGYSTEELLPGLSRTEARLCIHLLYADGTLVSGVEALTGVWSALPGFRLWGRFFQVVTSTPSHQLPPGYVEDGGRVQVKDDSARGAVKRKFLLEGIMRLPPRSIKMRLPSAIRTRAR